MDNEETMLMAAALDAGLVSRSSAMLLDARARTLALLQDLHGQRLLGPRLSIVNPPLWELGHVGWFQERWCLRRRPDGSLSESLLPHADALYDSARVPHDTRWDLPLPSLEQTHAYLHRVLESLLARITRNDWTGELPYFVALVVYHEDMHGEAFWYTRQTLGYPRPPVGAQPPRGWTAVAPAGDVAVEGGRFRLGAREDGRFVFDNEKWAHEVRLKPFAISRAPVTNEQFAAFVEDGGYAREELWSPAGWEWRCRAQAVRPVYWERRDGHWWQRRFDAWEPLPGDLPAIHVNWFEAEAWCSWAKRRLPTEAEWERAARGRNDGTYPWGEVQEAADRANLDGTHQGPAPVTWFPNGDSAEGCRQLLGNVWEWTSDWFLPYPGFVRDPYAEYSEPWFGTHKVLRGGCFATRSRLIRNTWRNFYTPDRRDVFAGFRTCALD